MVSPRALTRLVRVDSRAMTLDGMRVSVMEVVRCQRCGSVGPLFILEGCQVVKRDE